MPEIVFNDELWDLGLKYGCYTKSNCLCAVSNAVYISKSIDSFENGTVWNRLKLEFDISEDDYIGFSYFACDYKTVYHNNKLTNIDEIIEGALEPDVKTSLLDGLWTDEVTSPGDMPLCTLSGRYFWFKLRFVTVSHARIKKCKLHFRINSLSEYLPEFYSDKENNSEFLNRFLSMFQGVYLDLDKEISNISRILDIDYTQAEFLPWLSTWVAIDGHLVRSEDKLRKFIKNAYRFYKIKGTKECLLKAIALYTGKEPIIVETHETLLCDSQELYGTDIYSFTIIVDEESIPADEGVLGLQRIVEYYKPVYTNAKLIVLKPFLVIGHYSYLGINTRILENEELKINEKAMIPFIAIPVKD